MKIELVRKDCIFIAETEEESEILDTVFGTAVDENGLIGVKQCECRLADGYLEHYVLIKSQEKQEKQEKLSASPIEFPLDFFTPLGKIKIEVPPPYYEE